MKAANRDGDLDTLCPITLSTSLVGDRWSMVIIRELLMGATRFQNIQAQTGATPQMLTARLKRLETDGLIKRRAYSKKPLRHEYVLTPMGREFRPVVLALRAWGETWIKDGRKSLAVRITHSSCGSEIQLDGICPSCDALVSWKEMRGEPTPAYRRERARRAAAFSDHTQS